MSMKSADYGQSNDVSILNPQNEVTRKNIKSLFKKQKKSSKKSRNKKSPVMNNNNQKSEWHFEDDYNANQYYDRQFKPGETISTNLPLQNTSQKLFEMESTQEQQIKNTALNLIKEELKERHENLSNLTFRNQASDNSFKPYERE